LNQKRVAVYPAVLVVVFLVTAIGWLARSHNMVDPNGKPLGYDFITYWSASRMALDGHAAQAYNIPQIVQVEHTVNPMSKDEFAWFYPPTFFLVITPLALMPYLVAFAVFMLGTLAIYVVVVRKVVRGKEAMWCLAGFSGLWINLFQGQNAFLTAALAAGSLIAMEDSPILAGVLLGLLAIKPHLAILFPVALIAARAWKTMAAAAATSVLFVAAGAAVLGWGTLHAFVGSLATARQFIDTGALPWDKMPTVFTMLRMAHVPVTAAYVVHGIVALAATVVVWRVWRKSSDWKLRGATLMTATFLVSPYIFDYDMAWLAFPIAWMALLGMRDGWLSGEREVLVVVWVLPLVMALLAKVLTVQPAVLVVMVLLWMMMRRADGMVAVEVRG
jgi:hypothetical protein